MTQNSFSLDIPSAELLARIQELFRKWGAFAKPFTLPYQGQTFLVSCDARSFTIYRLNPHCHVPPGAPGWPVCLITAEMAADEGCAPHLEEDEFASHLTLQDWLELIQKTLGK
ncbi:MAG: hypothetical protein PHU44_10205 [Syntrophales bacterium]|nr:hypothetical protein [Syntrophales bacterium]MDD5642434.1 hypothetical protein [Syntrophales bacterium]